MTGNAEWMHLFPFVFDAEYCVRVLVFVESNQNAQLNTWVHFVYRHEIFGRDQTSEDSKVFYPWLSFVQNLGWCLSAFCACG